MTARPLLVVGAGPDGMSAAIAAADTGVAVTAIDDNAHPGGQNYRRPPVALDEPLLGQGPDAQRGADLRRRFLELGDRLELLKNARVWGVFPKKQLEVSTHDDWRMATASVLPS